MARLRRGEARLRRGMAGRRQAASIRGKTFVVSGITSGSPLKCWARATEVWSVGVSKSAQRRPRKTLKHQIRSRDGLQTSRLKSQLNGQRQLDCQSEFSCGELLRSRGSLPAGLSAATLVAVTTTWEKLGWDAQRARLGQDILRTGDEAGSGHD